jgi:hypothetical protein
MHAPPSMHYNADWMSDNEKGKDEDDEDDDEYVII